MLLPDLPTAVLKTFDAMRGRWPPID